MPFGIAGFYLGEIEHLVDQARQALGFARDDAEKFFALNEFERRVVVQDFGKCADRGQRCAQFMRHSRYEIVLQAVEFLQPLIGGAQFRGCDFEFA